MQVLPPTVDGLTGLLFDFLAVLMKDTQSEVFEVARELDLTLSQLRALFALAHCEEDPALTELAPAVGLSVAATGRLIDGLVRADLVDRREDRVDRRIKRVSLTARGNRTLERLAAARRDGLRRFVQTLSDEERAQFARALDPVVTRTPTHRIPEDQTR
jgi:DNA-binding MarR family transcriptional regulator